MKFKFFILFAVLLCICSTRVLYAVKNETSLNAGNIIKDKDYILIIVCHLETINWRHNYEDEIIKYAGSESDLNVYAEHINPLNISSMTLLDEKCSRLREKYTNRPKVIVFIGPAAYMMFAPSFNEQWKDIPMLYLGPKKRETSLEDLIYQRDIDFEQMYEVNASEMQRQYNVTGVWSYSYVKKTIDLMMKTIDGMNHLVWIGDTRQGSVVARMQAKAEILKNYPQLTVDYISPEHMSTNALLKKVASYDQYTGILFHTWYMSGEKTEEYYMSNNLYKMLSGFASAPIFTLCDMNTEMGYVAGGHFVLMEDLSKTAVTLLRRILLGEQARDIPFVMLESDKDYLNYSNLTEFHRNNIIYPDGVHYFQKPSSFFYKYRYQLLCILFVLLLIVFFILYKIRLVKNTQKLQRRELEMQKELQKEIAVRNFKLALSLQVSTVRPWILDLITKTVSYDNVEEIVANPQSMVSYRIYSLDVMFGWFQKEDVERFRGQIQSLADGITPYVKSDYMMNAQADEDGKNWYTMQAVVYERDNYGKPTKLIGTSMRITESKNVEIELREAKEKAEESNRLKSAFIANMSHEIRTPLNAIVGFSGIIAQSTEDKETQELAAIIQHNNMLLLRLINNILDLSRLESGAIEISESSVNVNNLIHQLVHECSSDLMAAVKISEDICSDKEVINVDEHQLMQVLENLLSNAIKFTRKGEIKIGYYPPKNGVIRFYVKDTGCGIPQNRLNTIFGRFVKLNNFEQGTGLGLSLCQLIAEKLGGQIGVFSEIGRGSEFWFEIPYKRSECEDGDKNIEESNERLKKEVILIAEDDENNYIILQSMLENDYQMVHAWNGEEAVAYFKKYNPSLILMDVRMPIKDGYAATEEIRRISATVPIIAITAYSLNGDAEHLRQNGFDAYEAKPLNRKALKNRITSLLSKNRNR